MPDARRRIKPIVVRPIHSARVRIEAIAVQKHPAAIAGHWRVVEVLVSASDEEERRGHWKENPFHRPSPEEIIGLFRAAA